MTSLRPASTVILLRDGPSGPEVFLVRRHEATAFMGGAHVFPGGAVDAADREADGSWCEGLAHARQQMAGLPPQEAVAFCVAAVRELFEEAGVLLAHDKEGRALTHAREDDRTRLEEGRRDLHAGRPIHALTSDLGVRLALDALTLSGHWVTPPTRGHRFDTRFFVARLPDGQEPTHDAAETTAGNWFTVPAALAAADRDLILLPPPTWTSLREIEGLSSVDVILEWARRRRVERLESQLIEENGTRMLVMPGHPRHTQPRLEPSSVETAFIWSGDRWRAR